MLSDGPGVPFAPKTSEGKILIRLDDKICADKIIRLMMLSCDKGSELQKNLAGILTW